MSNLTRTNPNQPWRKSSYSQGDGNCVEFAVDGDRALVRDTKDRQGPVLTFDAAAWSAFVKGGAPRRG